MKTVLTYINQRLVLTAILFMAAIASNAQIGSAVDPRPELGAMVHHQRQIHTVGLARLATVEARKILHEDLKVNMKDLETIDKAMDKVEKAFGIVDFLITGGVTAFHIYHTGEDVVSTFKKTKSLTKEYIDECLLRGNVKEGDTIFISVSRDMIETIYDGIDEIWKLIGTKNAGGLIELAAATELGVMSCSTDDMIFILEEICNNCDKIADDLKYEYYRLWQYMMLRRGYWKDLPEPRRPTREICGNAIERWIRSAGSDAKINY